MSSELPAGWVEVQLNDVAETCLGKMLDQKKTAGTLMPYLGNINVRWGKFDTTDLKTMPFEGTQIERYSVKMGDLVVCEGGEPGRCAIWNSEEPVMFQKALHRVRSGGALTNSYLQRRLSLDVQIGKLDELYTGTTIKHLTGASLEKYSFPLPPLNEQKRIVTKIDTLTEKSREARQALDEVPALLDQLRQSILAAAFRGDLTKKWREQNPDVEPASVLLERIRQERRRKWEESELAKFRAKGKLPPDDKWKSKYREAPEPDFRSGQPALPESWVWASVGELTECLDNQRVPVTRDDRSPGPYPYYGANGQVDSIDKFLFDDDLVLVTEDETFYGRTKPIAYRVSGRCWVNNHAHVLKPLHPLDADLIWLALAHYPVIPWLSGTTGRAKLTQASLNALPIALPPLDEQMQIIRTASAGMGIDAPLRREASESVQVLDTLDSSILAKAFRGELVPQDPTDEPASVLLERIRKEREGRAPKKSREAKGGSG